MPRFAVLVLCLCCAVFAAGSRSRDYRRYRSVPSAAGFSQSSSLASQWQTILIALQQNPTLLAQIRNNPSLLHNLQKGLLQQQQKQQSPKPQLVDQCSDLKKENARLKQMIRVFLEGGDPELAFLSEDSRGGNFRRNQRELDTAQVLLNQAVQRPTKPSVSLQRVLITPTPTWSTVVETTSYVTTVVEEIISKVPIILRGEKVITTIVEPTTVTVTATEMKTTSTEVVPQPTWSTMTVTVTPTQAPTPIQLTPSLTHGAGKSRAHRKLPSSWPARLNDRERGRPVDPRTGLEYADVLEVGRGTSPATAKTQLDRLKQAYAILLANSRTPKPNPIFTNSNLDFESLSDFDQQGLAAQARPVFVKNEVKKATATKAPVKAATVSALEPVTEKVFTLYFSGKTPGEYTTRLTTVKVDAATVDPISASSSAAASSHDRYKRQVAPTPVQPIKQTKAPSFYPPLESNEIFIVAPSPEDRLEEVEVQSSIETTTTTVTVTLTETLPSPFASD